MGRGPFVSKAKVWECLECIGSKSQIDIPLILRVLYRTPDNYRYFPRLPYCFLILVIVLLYTPPPSSDY